MELFTRLITSWASSVVRVLRRQGIRRAIVDAAMLSFCLKRAAGSTDRARSVRMSRRFKTLCNGAKQIAKHSRTKRSDLVRCARIRSQEERSFGFVPSLCCSLAACVGWNRPGTAGLLLSIQTVRRCGGASAEIRARWPLGQSERRVYSPSVAGNKQLRNLSQRRQLNFVRRLFESVRPTCGLHGIVALTASASQRPRVIAEPLSTD